MINLIFFPGLLSFVAGLFFSLNSSLQPLAESEKRQPQDQASAPLERFYEELRSFSIIPEDERLPFLDSCLIKYPSLPDVYLKIAEHFIVRDSIDAGIRRMAGREQSYLTDWAVARLEAARKNDDQAIDAYKSALTQNEPPPALVLEAAAHLFERTPDVIETTEDTLFKNWSSQTKTFWRAAAAYREARNEDVIRFLISLDEPLCKHPVVQRMLGSAMYHRTPKNKQEVERFRAEADSVWTASLEMCDEAGDSQNKLWLLRNKYFFLLEIADDKVQAGQVLEQALDLAEATQDYNHLQHFYAEKGWFLKTAPDSLDLDQIEQAFQTAAHYALRMKQSRDAVEHMLNLGQFFYKQNEKSKALEYYHRSDSLRKALGVEDESLHVKLLLDQGDVYDNLNQDTLAYENFAEALRIAQEIGLTNEIYRARVRFGVRDMKAGEYAKARAAFIEFLEAPDNNVELERKAYWTWQLAEAFLLGGFPNKAVMRFREAADLAREAKDVYYEIQCTFELIRLMTVDSTKYDSALDSLKQLFIRAIDNNLTDLSWQILFDMANLYKEKGEIDNAILCLKKAAEVIEANRGKISSERLRIGFFSEAADVYRELVDYYDLKYVKSNASADLDSIFKYLQFTRGREIVRNRLIENDKYRQAKDNLERLQREARMSGRIPDEHIARLEAARMDLINLQVTLQEEDDEKRAEIVSLDQAKAYTKAANIGLLFYHLYAENSFVLFVNAGTVRIASLEVEPDSVSAEVKKLMSPFYAVNNQEDVRKVIFNAGKAHGLFQKMFRPIDSVSSLPENLFIVRDTPVADLSFDILLREPPDSLIYTPLDGVDYKGGFLITKHAFAYSPSLSFMNESVSALPPFPQVLVSANPFGESRKESDALRRKNLRKITGWYFPPLPYAEIEGNTIAKNRSEVFLFNRDDASEKSVLLSVEKYDILHFATHAWFDSTFDAFSGIVLAFDSASTDDGLLMGYEIAQLKLHCDLVSLSACETGRGKIEQVEGVMGLPRLFTNAGVKSVIMTMWKLYDESGAEVMPAFYRFLLDDNLAKIEALAEAKRAFLEKPAGQNGLQYAHPFFWAAFSLYGQPGKVSSTISALALAIITVAALSVMVLVFVILRRKRKESYF